MFLNSDHIPITTDMSLQWCIYPISHNNDNIINQLKSFNEEFQKCSEVNTNDTANKYNNIVQRYMDIVHEKLHVKLSTILKNTIGIKRKRTRVKLPWYQISRHAIDIKFDLLKKFKILRTMANDTENCDIFECARQSEPNVTFILMKWHGIRSGYLKQKMGTYDPHFGSITSG